MSDKYNRLVTLLIDISTKVVLELFLDCARKDLSTGSTYSTLATYMTTKKTEVRRLKSIKSFQYIKIYPSSGSCIESEWDISLLSALIFGLYGTKVAPIRGDMIKIKDIRNELQHSASTASLSDEDYKTKWNSLSSASLSIARFVKGTSYETYIKEKIRDQSGCTFIPRLGETMRLWYTSYAEDSSSALKEEISSLNKKIEDQKIELKQVREELCHLREQTGNVETDCRSTSEIIQDATVHRPSNTGKPVKRIRTLDPILERLRKDFVRLSKQMPVDEVQPPKEIDEIRTRLRNDKYVFITGHGNRSYIEAALYAIKDLEQTPSNCVLLSSASNWEHIEPSEVELVLIFCPFGKGDIDHAKTKAFLDILDNIQLSINDPAETFSVMIVSQTEVFQKVLVSFNRHDLLENPVKIDRPNTAESPDDIQEEDWSISTQSTDTMQSMIEMSSAYKSYYPKINPKSPAVVRAKQQMCSSKVVLLTGDDTKSLASVALSFTDSYCTGQFLVVGKSDEIMSFPMRNISLLIVEDMAGKYDYDRQRVSGWLEKFDKLLPLVNDGKLNLIVTIASDNLQRCIDDFGQQMIFSYEVLVTATEVTSSVMPLVKTEPEENASSSDLQFVESHDGKNTAITYTARDPSTHIDQEVDFPRPPTISYATAVSSTNIDQVVDIRMSPALSYNTTAPELELVYSYTRQLSNVTDNVKVAVLSERLLVILTTFFFHETYILETFDRVNKCVLHTCDNAGKAYDSTNLTTTDIAVTFPSKGTVEIFTVSPSGSIVFINSYFVGKHCKGINCCNDHIVIAFGRPESKIAILDMNFVALNELKFNETLSSPCSLAVGLDKKTIYTIDSENDTVTALTREGFLIGVAADKDKLCLPNGITEDSAGHLYVSSFASHTVCLVILKTRTITKLLGKEDGVMWPEDVAFCKWTNHLLVYNEGIKEFKIS